MLIKFKRNSFFTDSKRIDPTPQQLHIQLMSDQNVQQIPSNFNKWYKLSPLKNDFLKD